MFRDASPAALSAFVLAIVSVGFAAGLATSSALPTARGIGRPIVNSNAWNETAPAQPVSYLQPATSQPACNRWQVSDVAMEEVLAEMIRHGWRAPSQGDAIAAVDAAGIAAAEPYAPMPQSRVWDASASSELVEGLPSGDPMPATTEPVDMQPAEAAKDERPPA